MHIVYKIEDVFATVVEVCFYVVMLGMFTALFTAVGIVLVLTERGVEILLSIGVNNQSAPFVVTCLGTMFMGSIYAGIIACMHSSERKWAKR